MVFRVLWRGRLKDRDYQPLPEPQTPDSSAAQPELPTYLEDVVAVAEVTSIGSLGLGKGTDASLGHRVSYHEHEESDLGAQLRALAPRTSWLIASFDPFATAAVAPDRTELLSRFSDLERKVHELFRGCASGIAQYERASGACDTAEKMWGSSNESSIFHTLLSIYTQRVYTRLLCPASTQNESTAADQTKLPVASFPTGMSRRRLKATLLTELKHSIIEELYDKFGVPPEHPALPPDFACSLRDVLLDTYQWNESAHWRDSDGPHGFHAFIAEPSSPWNAETMEAFCPVPCTDPNTETMVSSVSFGLKDDDGVHAEGSSTVVRKVKVLLHPVRHDTSPLARTVTTDSEPQTVISALFASELGELAIVDTRATSPQPVVDTTEGNLPTPEAAVPLGESEKLDAGRPPKKKGRVSRWIRKVVKRKSQ